jgi:hypothetical protein
MGLRKGGCEAAYFRAVSSGKLKNQNISGLSVVFNKFGLDLMP